MSKIKFIVISLLSFSYLSWGAAEGGMPPAVEDAYARALEYQPYSAYGGVAVINERLEKQKLPPASSWKIKLISAKQMGFDTIWADFYPHWPKTLKWNLFHERGDILPPESLKPYLFSGVVNSILSQFLEIPRSIGPVGPMAFMFFSEGAYFPYEGIPKSGSSTPSLKVMKSLEEIGVNLKRSRTTPFNPILRGERTEESIEELYRKFYNPIIQELEKNPNFVELGLQYLRFKIIEEKYREYPADLKTEEHKTYYKSLRRTTDLLLDVLQYWVALTIKQAIIHLLTGIPIEGASQDAAAELDHMYDLTHDHNRFVLLYQAHQLDGEKERLKIFFVRK